MEAVTDEADVEAIGWEIEPVNATQFDVLDSVARGCTSPAAVVDDSGRPSTTVWKAIVVLRRRGYLDGASRGGLVLTPSGRHVLETKAVTERRRKRRSGEVVAQVLAFVRSHGPVSRSEVEVGCDLYTETARRALVHLERFGVLRRDSGRWTA